MEDYIDIEDMFDINVSVCEVVSHDKRKVAYTVTRKADGKIFEFKGNLGTDGSYFNFYFEDSKVIGFATYEEDKAIEDALKATFDISDDEANELRFTILGEVSSKETEEKVKVFFENVEIKERREHETIFAFKGKEYTVNNTGIVKTDPSFELFEETYQIRDVLIVDDDHIEWNYIPDILTRISQSK